MVKGHISDCGRHGYSQVSFRFLIGQSDIVVVEGLLGVLNTVSNTFSVAVHHAHIPIHAKYSPIVD